MPSEIILQDKTYSCELSHLGNSAIQFDMYQNNHMVRRTGFIQFIWCMPLQEQLRTFLLVALHKKLSATEAEKSPFHEFPQMDTFLADATPSDEFCIIEPDQIVSHVIAYKHPHGTFMIQHEILVVCTALARRCRPM